LVVFTAETQLSDSFCSNNNLYRHPEKNADKDATTGYLEDNRRVRAIKLRGNQSNALAMNISCLDYLKLSKNTISQLVENTQFDELEGNPICQKYVVRKKNGQQKHQLNHQSKARFGDKELPRHPDTQQYLRNSENIPDDAELIITQKLHGTSVRLGHIQISHKMTLRDKIAKKFGVNVSRYDVDHVYGTRNTIRDPHNDDKSWYSDDVWSTVGLKTDDNIPEGFIVYGEICGYLSDDIPIQSRYTYECNPGENHLYVYRVSHVHTDSLGYMHMVELSFDQVKTFCRDNGLDRVRELWRGKKKDFNYEDYLDKQYRKYYDAFVDLDMNPPFPDVPVRICKDSPVDEGIVIRWDNGGLGCPAMYKVKGPVFYNYETKLNDKGEENIDEQ
jgi:hypothetical protein